MKEDGIRRVLLRGRIAKKDGCATLYLRDVAEVLRNHVEFCGGDDITFRQERGNALSRYASQSLITNYIQILYEGVRKKVMESHDNGTV